MRQYITFVMDPNEVGNNWSISFGSQDDKIVVGLHWGDKPTPTHEFKCSLSNFEKMALTLCPNLQKKS